MITQIYLRIETRSAEAPLGDRKPRGEGLESGADPLPAPASSDLIADAQSVPQRGLEGVLDVRFLQEFEDFPSNTAPKPISPGDSS
jgi:hypothetical protein